MSNMYTWESIKNLPIRRLKVIIYQKFSKEGKVWESINMGYYEYGQWYIGNYPNVTLLAKDELPTHWMPAPRPPMPETLVG